MPRQSEVAYINGAPSTPGYLMALLRELLHVPRGLTENAEALCGASACDSVHVIVCVCVRVSHCVVCVCVCML